MQDTKHELNRCLLSNSYVLSCEMKAIAIHLLVGKVHNCISGIFSEKSTTVFRVSFDESLWSAMWNLLCDMYGQHNP